MPFFRMPSFEMEDDFEFCYVWYVVFRILVQRMNYFGVRYDVYKIAIRNLSDGMNCCYEWHGASVRVGERGVAASGWVSGLLNSPALEPSHRRRKTRSDRQARKGT